jgi:hypothetical protein
MFCRDCGSSLEGPDKFCTKCGSPQPPAVPASIPPPGAASGQRSRRIWLYVGGALCLLVFMKVCYNFGSPETTITPAATQAAATHHRLGESISVGYWTYRCSSADWRSSIGSEYTRQYPDASFLVVNLGIRNNDRTASVLPPLKLVDAQGREYEESSKGIFLQKSFGMLKSVNPGVTSDGDVVFDVPQGQYMLKVSGGFGSGDIVLIDLQ